MMTATNPPTTLLFVRHGETDANVSGTWQGATDSPLNARGRAQAQALARRLARESYDIRAIYSSPLSRAHMTARIIAETLDHPTIHLEPALAEFDLGEWEGLTYEELRHEKRLWERMGADPTFAPPGGESAVAFATRLLQGTQAIVRRHAGETVVVVSHGGAIATALAMLLERDGSAWPRYQVTNCALTEVVFATEPRLVRFNDSKHLEQIGALGKWT
ncbi:MAG: histidine phosphatase family protein [Caldilineae bacterium]|nr:MAG: histidine phosphatase family protein [Caldilineae bacterium]